jgi:hypothetical protein
MRKDTILRIFSDLIPPQGIRHFDGPAPQLTVNSEKLADLLPENKVAAQWFLENRQIVSEEGIMRGVNLARQIYIEGPIESSGDRSYRAGLDDQTTFINLIRIACDAVEDDLKNKQGKVIKKVIYYHSDTLMGEILQNEDLRENIMDIPEFSIEDFEMLMVTSSIVTMARVLEEEGFSSANWHDAIREN